MNLLDVEFTEEQKDKLTFIGVPCQTVGDLFEWVVRKRLRESLQEVEQKDKERPQPYIQVI